MKSLDRAPQPSDDELDQASTGAARRLLGNLATRSRKGLALGTVVAVAAAGAATAKAGTGHPEKSGTPTELTLHKENYEDKIRHQAVTECLTEANHSRKPNIFYGAIVAPRASAGTHTSVHLSPTKKLFERGGTVPGGPLVLVNSVITECNGRLYAIGYDRGDVVLKEHLAGTGEQYNQLAKDGLTKGKELYANIRFVDLGEALRINNGRLNYYTWNGEPAQMVHSTVRDGMRAIDEDSEKFPTFNDVDGFWYGFTPAVSFDPTDKLEVDNYLRNKGLVNARYGYEPPFIKTLRAMAAQNTFRD